MENAATRVFTGPSESQYLKRLIARPCRLFKHVRKIQQGRAGLRHKRYAVGGLYEIVCRVFLVVSRRFDYENRCALNDWTYF